MPPSETLTGWRSGAVGTSQSPVRPNARSCTQTGATPSTSKGRGGEWVEGSLAGKDLEVFIDEKVKTDGEGF